MDGSRGATGAVDVGVSHLNMNINVMGGGHGLGSATTTTTTAVGVPGSSDANTGDSASSSPPVRAPESSLCAAHSPSVCLAMPAFLPSGFSLAWLAVPAERLCLWRRSSEALDRPPIHTYHTTATIDSWNSTAATYIHAIRLQLMASARCTHSLRRAPQQDRWPVPISWPSRRSSHCSACCVCSHTPLDERCP